MRRRPLAGSGGPRHAVANGVVAALFAVTGPLAILLAVAIQGGLDDRLTNSWIFAAYVLGGGLSVAFSVGYRQPLGLAWKSRARSCWVRRCSTCRSPRSWVPSS